MNSYDVTALGELLIDFTQNGFSDQGNPIFEANPGGAPCNVLALLQKMGRKTAFIGKVGNWKRLGFRQRAFLWMGMSILPLPLYRQNPMEIEIFPFIAGLALT